MIFSVTRPFQSDTKAIMCINSLTICASSSNDLVVGSLLGAQLMSNKQ